MRTMIAVPCMDMVHTLFFASVLSLRKSEDTEVSIASCSLVYEARHTLALKAINDGFDRVLWLDSDMVFQQDLLIRMKQTMDEKGLDFLTGLYFRRVPPFTPVLFDQLDIEEDGSCSAAYHGENKVGECDFRDTPDGWVIYHTEVLPEFGGRGIAKRLVFKIAEEAEKRKINVIPTCSYAVKVLKQPENRDGSD